MLTYVINTSENKTFDSDRLFDLAGYSKIRWMNCSLKDIASCEKEIYEKQNALGADSFRVVVLVDFFGFRRIRPPYGRGEHGFGLVEEGVEFAVYLPYIEAYLVDKLFNPLTKRDIYISACEVYYIQNGEYERFESLDNRENQVATILRGKPGTEVALPPEPPHVTDGEETFEDRLTQAQRQRVKYELEKRPEKARDLTAYSAYELYCTETMSLELKIEDYPYGAANGTAMDFHTFFEAFRRRAGLSTSLRRHYYVTQYGESPVRAAFDTLSLSLYLIRTYEREENTGVGGELKIATIEPSTLREVLERSWNKIHAARNIARGNRTMYFELDQTGSEEKALEQPEREPSYETHIAQLRAEIRNRPENVARKMSALDMYHRICRFANRSDDQVDKDNRRQFDDIMSEYLKKRDATSEAGIDAEFREMRSAGILKMTDQCPSREKYENLIRLKEKEISDLFDRALKADLLEVDYSEERTRAKSSLKAYNRAKACMSRNIIGDIIFLALTLAAMLIPYGSLQLRDATLLSLGASTLYALGAIIFGGLFLLAFAMQMMPLMRRMSIAKGWIRHHFYTCLAKNEYAFSKLKQRYEHDLIRIEELRYELRQIEHMYDANLTLEKNVTHHRNMLEEVEDQLSAMLNNLGVEPIYQPEESVENEFDLTKPFHAKENGVYKVFSIETIEGMFQKKKKGSDEQ